MYYEFMLVDSYIILMVKVVRFKVRCTICKEVFQTTMLRDIQAETAKKKIERNLAVRRQNNILCFAHVYRYISLVQYDYFTFREVSVCDLCNLALSRPIIPTQ